MNNENEFEEEKKLSKKQQMALRIEQLEKDLQSMTNSKKYAEDAKKTLEDKCAELNARIDSLHCVFDSLPNVISRTVEVEDGYYGKQDRDRTVESRMISFLSTLIRSN